MGLFDRGPAIMEMDPQEAAAAMKAGAVLLDVRELSEWQMGHAVGATHIPLTQLQSKIAELPAGRRGLCICASGSRSKSAATILTQAGRKDVANVRGGTFAWSRAGLPMAR